MYPVSRNNFAPSLDDAYNVEGMPKENITVDMINDVPNKRSSNV
jgi:hypothetical protein